jgi:hypothetical protein
LKRECQENLPMKNNVEPIINYFLVTSVEPIIRRHIRNRFRAQAGPHQTHRTSDYHGAGFRLYGWRGATTLGGSIGAVLVNANYLLPLF